jgi:predicted SAM-dependent methyltransferase
MKYYTVARTILPKPLRKSLSRRYEAQPEFVREALRNLRNEFRVARIVRESNRKFETLKNARDLKVHLGCGPYIKPGWVNIDLTENPPQVDPNAPPETMFINYDLRLGLPLSDASVELIYSSHFFEHLEYKHGMRLLRDCYRALRPGGLFRISLPDFKGSFEAYLRADEKHFDLINIHDALPDIEPGTETIVDHINFGVYQHGEHKCIYDEEKIIAVLKNIGYSSVEQTPFRNDIDPDEPVRLRHSFYVEAVK